MKVIEPGRTQKGWSSEFKCTGRGNGGGGCGARLLVEQADLYHTFSSALHESDTHTTFTCSECGVETDDEGRVPSQISKSLPTKSVWVARKVDF